MEIQEEREERKALMFSQREIGAVYRDADGDLVIADDEEGVVRLSDGFRWSPGPNTELTPVNTKLVVKS